MTNEQSQQSGSNPLLEGEELLWYRVLNQGWIRKKICEIIIVSTRRVILEYPLQGKMFTMLLEDIDDVQVLDQRRDSNMNMTGVGVRGGHLRIMQYQGQSRSKSIGSILLMSSTKIDFTLPSIQDPKGLSEVISKAVKMRKKELEDQQLR